jgi:acyl carrier protein
MASADAQTAARVERMGMSLIKPEAGLAALESALLLTSSRFTGSPAVSTVAAIPLNWPTFLARQGAANTAGFFAEFAAAAGSRADKQRSSRSSSGAIQAGAGRPAAEALQQQVSQAVSGILGHAVAADEPLVAAGLDSLGSVELRTSLQASLRVELPATLVSFWGLSVLSGDSPAGPGVACICGCCDQQN